MTLLQSFSANMDITKWNIVDKINDFRYDNRITYKDMALLIEAYRRQYLIGKPEKPLAVAWVGLGVPSQYKSKYFRPLGKEIPRANNWYLFTEEGIEIFKKLIIAMPVPEDWLIRSKWNAFLFEHQWT